MTGRASESARALAVRRGGAAPITRALPEETAVALVYNGTTQAVMMASPADLEDFAIGFSISEGIVSAPEEIAEIEVVAHGPGIEARMWIAEDRAEALQARRRALAGPVGCGLCGIDSLEGAIRPLPELAAGGATLSGAELCRAMGSLRDHQPLHDKTRAVHAAGFWRKGEGLFAVREDVGRHNALDKLIGALLRAGVDPATGAVLLTSRVSVELIQKAAMLGAPIVAAVSAPTAHAVRLAEDAGVTVAANVRDDGYDLFAHPDRITDGETSDVA